MSVATARFAATGNTSKIYPSLELLEQTIDRLSKDFDPPLSNPSTPTGGVPAHAHTKRSVSFEGSSRALSRDVGAAAAVRPIPSAPVDDTAVAHSSVTSLTSNHSLRHSVDVQPKSNEPQAASSKTTSQNSLQVPAHHRRSVPVSVQLTSPVNKDAHKRSSLPVDASTVCVTIANKSNAVAAHAITSQQQPDRPVSFSIGGSDLATGDFESFDSSAGKEAWTQHLSTPYDRSNSRARRRKCVTE